MTMIRLSPKWIAARLETEEESSGLTVKKLHKRAAKLTWKTFIDYANGVAELKPT